MTKLSYGDMIVIRWSSTLHGPRSEELRGLTNRAYNFDQLKALGFWKDFQQYFQMTKRLIEADPDPIDLGLMSGLAIMTSDRDLYKEPDRSYIYPIQEHLARLLKAKCDLQGKGISLTQAITSYLGNSTKFTKIMSVLAQLRKVVRQSDLDQCLGFKPKILTNTLL